MQPVSEGPQRDSEENLESFFDVALGQSLVFVLGLECSAFLGLLISRLTAQSFQWGMTSSILVGGALLSFLLLRSPGLRLRPHLHLIAGLAIAAGCSTLVCTDSGVKGYLLSMQILTIAVGMLAVRLPWASLGYAMNLFFWCLGLAVLPESEVSWWAYLVVAITFMTSGFFLWLRRRGLESYFQIRKKSLHLSDKLYWVNSENEKTERALLAELESGADLLEKLDNERAAFQAERSRIESGRERRMSGDLGQMAGGVARDFNNLLTVIQLNLDHLLEVHKENSEIYQDLQDALLASRRIESVVQQLLAFGSTGASNWEPLMFSERIGSCRVLLESLFREDVELNFRIRGRERAIRADRHQIDLLLFSLASQVHRLAPPGSVLTIEVQATEENCCLRFSDNAGILASTAEARDEVLGAQALAKGSGFTLLAISTILANHSGWYQFDGDALACYFPFAAQSERVEHETGASRQLSDGPILLYEPELLIRRFLEEHLEQRGYQVKSFSESPEFEVESWQGPPPSVLIADYHGPECEGYKLMVRARRAFQGLAFLLFATDRRTPLPRDFDCELLQKPFSMARLEEVLGDIVERAA